MKQRDESVLFRPLRETPLGLWMVTGLLVAVVGWAIFAYVWQVIHGLGVTGMGKPVFWGVYITNFVFFIGISHAGTLISAILRVTGAEWRRPITRAAEAITVFALILGVSNILIDMGRPDRVINIMFFGRLQSPLLWDITSVTVYLISSLTYLYLPLIPDLAILRDRLTNVSRWRRRLYTTLSLGWTGSPEQVRRLEKAIGILAVLIIPVAVSVHTVVSWVFSMTVQPMWHSTIFGPYFVVGAIFSGIAAIIIVMAILRRMYHLEEYLKPVHFNNLGLLLMTMCVIWFYFTFAEYLTELYGSEIPELTVFLAKVVQEFSPLFWVMVLFNFVIPFAVLVRKKTRTIAGTVFVSITINIGMWLERYTIIVPTLTRPRLPYEWGVYTPTWVEWSILAGCFALFALLYVLFSKLFPVISIWEVREGEHIEAVQARVRQELAAEATQ